MQLYLPTNLATPLSDPFIFIIHKRAYGCMYMPLGMQSIFGANLGAYPHFGNLAQNSKYKKQLNKKYLQHSIDLHILWYMWCHGARNFIAIYFIHRSFTILPFLLFTHRENTLNNEFYTTTNFSTKYYNHFCNSILYSKIGQLTYLCTLFECQLFKKYFSVYVFCTFAIPISSFSPSVFIRLVHWNGPFKFNQFSL